MFTPENFIDAVVKAKKQWVATVVKNDVAAKAMNEFVDAQAAYTKEAVATFTKVGVSLYKETIASAQKVVNKDYAKAYTSKA